jgi:nitrogen fixation NifU-like protein
LYEEHVLDHYKHPRGRGTLADANMVFHDTNPLCGDKVTVHLRVVDGVVVAARHESSGCAISQAGTSMLFESIEGKRVADVLVQPNESVLAEFGSPLSVSRIKCALLGLTALKKALVHHESKE